MKSKTFCSTLAAAAFAVAMPAILSSALAEPGHAANDTEHMAGQDEHHASGHGQPGDAAQASRTVTVEMLDNYYEPERIAVKAGETVRFVISNGGGFVHEFNIGTPEMHAAHQDEMMMMVEHGVLLPDRIDEAAGEAMQAAMGHGKHDDPNSALLEPGQSAEVVWTFPADGIIEFACNVPGHYDSGMAGDFEFVKTLAQN